MEVQARHTGRVAVVGAGIAGLALAAELGRAGITCRVFEQAPRLGEVGAGIQLAPNAVRLLHRLGLADVLRDVAVRPEAIELRRWDDNRVIARTTLGAECEDRYSAPYYTVHRADLHGALVETVGTDVIELDRRYESVSETADGVRIGFAHGAPVAAEVLVGADGIHSTVRKELSADRPRYSGQGIYRSVVPVEALPAMRDEPKVVLWLGPRQHLVCYPISAGKQVSVAATTPVVEWQPESWTAPASPGDLRSAYADWHPAVRAVVEAAEQVTLWALHDRDPIPDWTTGRIALLGDAAHPMLPFFAQGANQAVEDACVLAASLSLAGGTRDVAPALARYAAARRDRAEKVQEISRRNSRALHVDDGSAQRDRDAQLSRSQRLAEQEWLYGYDATRAVGPDA
ncbi:FAD-dependent monooxygenase [Myceligenerans halotolerans]